MHLPIYLLTTLLATTASATSSLSHSHSDPHPPLPSPTPPETLPSNISPNATDAAIFNQTLPPLESRGHYGWVTSFANSDPFCIGGYGGARPKIKSSCVEFHPLQNVVKIDWGTGPLGFKFLNVYKDAECKDYIRTLHKGDSGDSCISTFGVWGSVHWEDSLMGHIKVGS